jgi:nitrogen fixation/metabolism regulation signal transduction histidine kinase
VTRRRGLGQDRLVLVLALLAGLPGSGVALVLLWTGGLAPRTEITLTLLIVAGWVAFAVAAGRRVLRPLQSVAGLLGALAEGDFSLRGRGRGPGDPLEEVMREINLLGDTLREQRLEAIEAGALLRKVMEEIDAAVFAFDADGRLRLVNRAGARLLGRPPEQLVARTAAEVGLARCLPVEDDDRDEPARAAAGSGGASSAGSAAAPRLLDLAFPGGAGRFEVNAARFRQGGVPHRLLVLSDLSRALREEERQAWQRLIRVVGHELNNSLAPIRSLAGSLQALAARDPLPPDWRDDMKGGLSIIGGRAEALARFMEAYARLARLPPPRLAEVEIGALVRRVAGLETHRLVEVRAGARLLVRADPDLLEQLLINLVRNAVEAAGETGGGVAVAWGRAPGGAAEAEIRVEDEGPGLPASANLFVPFFTTKAGGSGIGLVLCREIAEAHGGQLVLENRAEGRGSVARLRLPLVRAGVAPRRTAGSD